ncbi:MULTISPECIES: sensor histidine kinase [unclassified Streptomyces]|uniref:sensor histidine kinase n=1 Tax=unclassified Streptomyces TaxID=2593676 RepID=UPI0011E73471|nr:histidine kinase [Streptomyces sp. sk2.1]TXS72342.1 two-component sensor histidine kinase [Streptomyces sp. sk2.1]
MTALGALRNRISRFERKDVLPAAGLFVVGAALYAVGWYPFFRDVHTFALWNVPIGWRLISLGGACAAVLVRRRLPMSALGAGLFFSAIDVLMGFSISMLLVLSELLYSATLHASRYASRMLVRTVIALMVVFTTVLLSVVHDWQVIVLLVMLMLTIMFVPVWWAMTVRQERDVAEAERSRAEQQATIAELDRRTAVSEERARMARELHDVIAGHLSAIAIQSDAVGSMSEDRAAVDEVLRTIRKNSVDALREMRAMIELLRGQNTEGEQVSYTAPARLAELDALLESARAAGLDVTVTVGTEDGPVDDPAGGPLDGLPASVDLAAYRIVQEALTNAVKHATGARTWVTVRPEGGDLYVEIVNELAGEEMSVLPGAGIGLLNMHERAVAIGGTISAEPVGDRWRVHAVLPLGGEREHEHEGSGR